MEINIDNFEIRILKYNQATQEVIANVTVCGVVEIRGYVARFTVTKYSHGQPVWIATPPCIKTKKGKYFWVPRITDLDLWKKLQDKIINAAKEYTNNTTVTI